ncbi:MAG: hypothetical protein HC924_12680 [Synechococcaceae cyanobacterium SM2_3_2]|nr:hypothetical protein [Synechococcaceae cyanobacterium SM2_3_2]
MASQVPTGTNVESQSISLYYDGNRTSIQLKDAAILFASLILFPADSGAPIPAANATQIAAAANGLLGNPVPAITVADVTGLGNLSPSNPLLSDFDQDGVVNFTDAAFLFAAALLAPVTDVTVLNPVASQLLGIPGSVNVNQAFFNALTNPPGQNQFVFFLDPLNGDDTNPGTSEANAFRTIRGVLEGQAGNAGFRPFDLANQGNDVVIQVVGVGPIVVPDFTASLDLLEVSSGSGSLTVQGNGNTLTLTGAVPGTGGALFLSRGVRLDNFNIQLSGNIDPGRNAVIALLDRAAITNSTIGNGTQSNTNNADPTRRTVLIQTAGRAELIGNVINCNFAAAEETCVAILGTNVGSAVFSDNTISEASNVGGTLVEVSGNGVIGDPSGATRNIFEGIDSPTSILIEAESLSPLDELRIIGNNLTVGANLNSTGVLINSGGGNFVGIGGQNPGLRNNFIASQNLRGVGVRNGALSQGGLGPLAGSNNFPVAPNFLAQNFLAAEQAPFFQVVNACSIAPGQFFTVTPALVNPQAFL